MGDKKCEFQNFKYLNMTGIEMKGGHVFSYGRRADFMAEGGPRPKGVSDNMHAPALNTGTPSLPIYDASDICDIDAHIRCI